MLMVDVGSRDLQESYIGAKGQAAVASSRADEAADFRNLMRPRAKDACGWHRDERKHCTGPAEGRLCLRQGCWVRPHCKVQDVPDDEVLNDISFAAAKPAALTVSD